jgi:hypothetical protein
MDAPYKHCDDDVEVGGPSSIASDAPSRRDLRSSVNELSPSATEDEEEETVGSQGGKTTALSPLSLDLVRGQHHYSEPGAFAVGETGNVETMTALFPGPEINHFRENTQGQYLADANLVSEPDLLVGEIVEDTKGFWRQRNVQCCTLFLLLLVIGAVVGVTIGVTGGSGQVTLETREQLREAVDLYLVNNGPGTLVARSYGWPIGAWDVSKIQDFSYLFSADGVDGSDRFNPAAESFNEDITLWDLSSATSNMRVLLCIVF